MFFAESPLNRKGNNGMMQEGKPERWRGILANEQTMARRIVAAILCVLVVAMVSAQQSFFPFANTHIMFLLVPISLTALLLGKWQGCAIGALAGAAEMCHSLYLPYDFYEVYFASPHNSIALFALYGLLVGGLFALACRLPRRSPDEDDEGSASGIARKLALAGACAVGAIFATGFLQLGIQLLNTSIDVHLPAQMAERLLGAPSSIAQAALDMLAIMLAVIATDLAAPRLSWTERKRSVRVTFQVWLGIITIVFFFVASGVSFAAITIIGLGNMDVALSDHVEKLSSELAKRDEMMATIDEHSALSHDEKQEIEKMLYDDIDCDLPGWLQDTVIIANEDKIFASNVEGLEDKSFASVVGGGLVRESLNDVLSSGRTHLYYQGNDTQISYLLGNKIGYEYLDNSGNLRAGSYQIATIVTSREVFLHRWLFMTLVGLVFAILFGSLFVLALKLVDIVVVKPIEGANEVLNRITAGELDQRVADSNSSEFALLSTGINTTVGALEGYIAEANTRIDRELATARAIQNSALPTVQTPFPDIDVINLYATMEPAREVGGDFFDFFELSRRRIGFVVADVSGKGIPAALFMMSAMTAIRGAMEAKADLAKAIDIANRSLCKGNDSEMFVTAFAGVIEYETGKLTYVNAGHNKPLLMRDGQWQWLNERSGPFLGMFDWVDYKKFEMQLQQDDMLFAYTDGVNEAFNADEKIYGNDRLEAFLATHNDLYPRRLLRAMRNELIEWADGAVQSDDITMLALQYGISQEHDASLETVASLDYFEQVEGFVMQHLDECGCSPKAANQILIAVEELVVNVCNYAYSEIPEGQPNPLRVHFTWTHQPNTIVIEIADDGKPFNPLAREDPERPDSIEEAKVGGLGLFMVKQLMDEVEYVREGITNVTIITKHWD